MGRSCGARGGQDMCVLSFGRETRGKGSVLKNKPTRRREDDIKVNFEEIGCDCLDCIYLPYSVSCRGQELLEPYLRSPLYAFVPWEGTTFTFTVFTYISCRE